VSEPLGDSPLQENEWQLSIGVFGCWGAGSAASCTRLRSAARRSTCSAWMRTRARRRHAAGSDTAPRRAGSLRESLLAREGGIGRTADGFGGLVDVNSASVEEFAQLPGISSEIGRRVVEVRERFRFGARLREPPRPAAPLRRRTP
jgi:Helix-hairpin-helix motif